MRMHLYGIACCLLLPGIANAAVSFSEIAWMGTAASANDEWLELHNDGQQSVTIDGWTITDGNDLTIKLSGSIPAGAYVVLERTDDTTVSGNAFLVYTGALVNSGATLRLTKPDGALVDQVAGGEDWQYIGGDNETKDTAQYTSAGWVTAPPTPGAASAAPEPNESTDDSAESNESSSSATQQAPEDETDSDPVYLTVPGVTLELRVSAPTRGYVNQPIDFAVTPAGVGEHLIASLAYEWNFGDGTTATKKAPQHTFAYPGTYVVAVHAGYKRQEQVARHEITILPVRVSLTANDAGDVQVHNDSPYELDLSGYRLVGERAFTFPPRTIVLANQTITLPQAMLGDTKQQMVALYDREETLLASRVPEVLRSTAAPAAALATAQAEPAPQQTAYRPQPIAPQTTPTNVAAQRFGFVGTAETENTGQAMSAIVAGAATTTASTGADSSTTPAAPAQPQSDIPWPYLGLAGVLVAGVTGVLVSPRRNESS